MTMLRRALVMTTLAALSWAGASPAQAAEPSNESYLFVVDGEHITITPGKGSTALVTISDPQTIRFTDRPGRQAEDFSVRSMLKEFGWTAASGKLKPATPNAAIAIAGQRSQIVDIQRARVTSGALRLTVKGLTGKVAAASGQGSVFIDNAVVFPVTQTVTLSSVGSVPVTLTSDSSATVTVTAGGQSLPLSVSPQDPTTSARLNGVINEQTASLQINVESTWNETSVQVTIEVVGNLGVRAVQESGSTTFAL